MKGFKEVILEYFGGKLKAVNAIAYISKHNLRSINSAAEVETYYQVISELSKKNRKILELYWAAERYQNQDVIDLCVGIGEKIIKEDAAILKNAESYFRGDVVKGKNYEKEAEIVVLKMIVEYPRGLIDPDDLIRVFTRLSRDKKNDAKRCYDDVIKALLSNPMFRPTVSTVRFLLNAAVTERSKHFSEVSSIRADLKAKKNEVEVLDKEQSLLSSKLVSALKELDEAKKKLLSKEEERCSANSRLRNSEDKNKQFKSDMVEHISRWVKALEKSPPDYGYLLQTTRFVLKEIEEGQ